MVFEMVFAIVEKNEEICDDTANMPNKITVIAVGGSLIVPHLTDSDGIAVPFLRALRKLLLAEIKQERRFIVIPGGGKTCRVYQKAGRQIVRMSNDDLDWIGIHSTRLNAHLLRTIFAKEAHPVVVDHDPSPKMIRELLATGKKLFIASGWRPGWSTDYIAIRLAQKFGASEVIDAGDIDFVYDKDPNKFSGAQPISHLSWKEYRKLIPSRWTPGLSSPVDPVAAKLAQKAGIHAKIIKGTDLANLKRAIEDKKFIGTVIS